MAHDQKKRDLVAQPLSFVWAWGLPTVLLIAVSVGDERLPAAGYVIAVSGAFLWMGAACLINARRCRRLHCFLSGPVFLIGAFVALLIGFGTVSVGSVTTEHVVWFTVGLALLSFVPEAIRGKYLR